MIPQQKSKLSAGQLAMLMLLFCLVGLMLLLIRQGLSTAPSAQTPDFPDPDPERGTVSYAQMVADYRRPDVDAILNQIQAVIDGMDSYDKPTPLLRAVSQAEDLVDQFQDQFTFVSIWYSIDTSDQAAQQEYRYFSDQDPVLTDALHRLYAAVAGSPHAHALEMTGYGDGYFASFADGGGHHSRLSELQAQEAALMARYDELTTGQTVVFQGEDILWNDLAADPDLTGGSYEEAVQVYYDTYASAIGELMIQLIPIRQELAQRSGYDSYEEYMFDSYYRDYTPEQALAYAQDVCRELAPLSLAAEENGLWPDEAPYLPLSEEDLRRAVSASLAAMEDASLLEAWDFMDRYGLADLTNSPYKVPGGYEQYMALYETPFIVLNTDSAMTDIQSFSHEFGHFYDDYINQGWTWSTELAEVESQAMERLVLAYAGGSLDEDILDGLRDYLLLDGMDTLVWQCLYHTFESRMYQLTGDELTVQALHDLYYEVCEEFGMAEADRPYYYQYGWIDISHFFSLPFYIISYPLSCDAAMQIGELEEEAPSAGLEVYLRLVELAPSGPFEETLGEAGLVSPLTEGRAAELAAQLAEHLGLAYPSAA